MISWLIREWRFASWYWRARWHLRKARHAQDAADFLRRAGNRKQEHAMHGTYCRHMLAAKALLSKMKTDAGVRA